MQPPDTLPTTRPSLRRAIIEPTGRGEEPHVRATVARTTRWPALSQSLAVRRTSRSILSIYSLLFRPRCVLKIIAGNPARDGDWCRHPPLAHVQNDRAAAGRVGMPTQFANRFRIDRRPL